MKKIRKNEYGLWQEVLDNNSDFIEVSDDIMPDFMNSSYYLYDNFSVTNYQKSWALFEIEQSKRYLSETDYITIQWEDEEKLGIEHNRTEQEYMDILQKRQEAREKIRSQLIILTN